MVTFRRCMASPLPPRPYASPSARRCRRERSALAVHPRFSMRFQPTPAHAPAGMKSPCSRSHYRLAAPSNRGDYASRRRRAARSGA